MIKTDLTDTDSREFVRLVKQGDEDSFKRLYIELHPKILAYVKGYLKDLHVSEEICQDVFLYLWEKRTWLAEDTRFLPYLLRIARNKCLNQIKAARIRPIPVGEWDAAEWNMNFMALEDKSADRLLTGELEGLIDSGIEAMPEACRELFLLSRDKGMKYREIAEKTGIPIKTVESRMSKSLEILRSKLSDYLHVILF